METDQSQIHVSAANHVEKFDEKEVCSSKVELCHKMDAILSKFEKIENAIGTDAERRRNFEIVATCLSKVGKMAEQIEEVKNIGNKNARMLNLLFDRQSKIEEQMTWSNSELVTVSMLIMNLKTALSTQSSTLNTLINEFKSGMNQISSKTSEVCNTVLSKQDLVVEKINNLSCIITCPTRIILNSCVIDTISDRLDELCRTMVKRNGCMLHVLNSQQNKIKQLTELEVANSNRLETQIRNANKVSHSTRCSIGQLKSKLSALNSRVNDSFNDENNSKIQNVLCGTQTYKLNEMTEQQVFIDIVKRFEDKLDRVEKAVEKICSSSSVVSVTRTSPTISVSPGCKRSGTWNDAGTSESYLEPAVWSKKRWCPDV